MGIIRTLLALSVVLTHAHVAGLVGGRMAVQLFYMISGFLISFILTERKSYSTATGFYLNRVLRLAPIYFVIAGLTMFFHCVALTGEAGREFFQTFSSLGWPGRGLLAATNISIFGQDAIMFLGTQDGALHWTSNFRDSSPQLWKGLLAPQSWTLALELSFYLLAPFIIGRTKLVWGLLIGSFAVRFLLFGLGLALKDPWSYRFFPAELGLFLAGAISHQKLSPLYQRVLIGKLDLYSNGATFLIVALLFAFPILPYPQAISILLLVMFTLTLPLLFTFQRRHKWDSIVGEYSYPIYMSHMLVIWILPDMNQSNMAIRLIVTCAATGVFSHLLLKYVAHPIELLRNRLRAKMVGDARESLA